METLLQALVRAPAMRARRLAWATALVGLAIVVVLGIAVAQRFYAAACAEARQIVRDGGFDGAVEAPGAATTGIDISNAETVSPDESQSLSIGQGPQINFPDRREQRPEMIAGMSVVLLRRQ